MFRFFCPLLVLGLALVVPAANAQNPPEKERAKGPKGMIYAHKIGNDTVVYLAPGLKFEVLPSDKIGAKAVVVVKSDGGLSIRDRTPRFVEQGGDTATLKLAGAFKGYIDIGVPPGYKGEVKVGPK